MTPSDTFDGKFLEELATATTAATPPKESDSQKRVTQLLKQRRKYGTGCTLNHDNVKMLTENWLKLVNVTQLEQQWRAFLSDRSESSMVLREHDFELLKAIRSFVQSARKINEMIDARVEELNTLVEENKELFEQLKQEYLETLRQTPEGMMHNYCSDNPQECNCLLESGFVACAREPKLVAVADSNGGVDHDKL